MFKISSKFFISLIILAAFVYFGIDYVIPRLEQKDKIERKFNSFADSGPYIVTKVVDGDTFEVEVNGVKEKVRMLGIDTPEKYESGKLDRDTERTKKDKNTIKKLGKLASDYAKKLLDGKKVRLEADESQGDKDRYGRLLRYVYLEDGTFINLKLVEDGYANAYTKFDVSKKDEFIAAERRARENKKGLWGDIEGLEYMGNN